MTDHTMAAMDAALQLTDKALQKPPDLRPGFCRCSFCGKPGRAEMGEMYVDLFLCQDCKDWGNALALVARTLANRVDAEGPIVVGMTPDEASLVRTLLTSSRISGPIHRRVGDRISDALARYERNKP